MASPGASRAKDSARDRAAGPSVNEANTVLPTEHLENDTQAWNAGGDFAAQERETISALAAQEKQRIKLYQVPVDSADKPLPDEFVHINGHGYLIKRGEWVEVPTTVVEVLEQAGRL